MTDYTEKQAWKAIAERDPTYDGKLYYGVMTTGVFCRPSCPSGETRQYEAVHYSAGGDGSGLAPMSALPSNG